MTSPIKTVFFGTPHFVVPVLEVLRACKDVELIAVIAQPDRPSGRKKELKSPATKVWAQERDIPVLQPESLKTPEIETQLRELDADLFVVAGYGMLIPDNIISLPQFDAINIHPSRLPEYRGPTPIQAAILDGKETSAVSIILVRSKMDAGPLLAQESFDLGTVHTAEELYEKAFTKGGRMLVDLLPAWVNGTHGTTEQDDSLATFCKLTKKEDAEIDWTCTSRQIRDRLRAYTPWPGIYTTWKGKRLKILELGPEVTTQIKETQLPGTISTHEGLHIATGDGWIEATQVQLEGKQPQSAEAFLHGTGRELEGEQLPS
ncbi:MAG: methionyl-tRNA formyltransferase [Candidatus Andersenbacteria bacterium]|nr:methionyl-tRNA formyltransferase [Candidatus Andersenbacteria bacterium]